MKIKEHSYMSKMRVEKSHPNQDAIRVLIVGFTICFLFIVVPTYLVKKLVTEYTPVTQVED